MAVVEREQRGRVAVIWLNRPDQRNALSSELADALLEELRAAGQDEGTGAVVLAANGRAFCAGGDLKGSLGASDGFLASHLGRGAFADLLRTLHTLEVPVVAAVAGDAMGGGLGLVSACDLVVAESGARFGTPEIGIGLFPWIILVTLMRDVPRKQLAELVYTGGRWSAEEARQIGLINHVVGEGEAVGRALELATRIAERSPAILALGKAAFHRVADQRFDDALDFMHSQLTLNLLTEDAAEGIAAFVQKREPRWRGR